MFPSPYINRFHPHTSTQHRSTFLRRLSRGRGPIREYGFIAENGENCGEPQGGMPAENANCNPGHHPRNTVTLQRMATHRRWHETRPRLLMLIFKSIMNVCWRLLQLLFFFFLHLMASLSLSLISLQTSRSHCSGADYILPGPPKTLSANASMKKWSEAICRAVVR